MKKTKACSGAHEVFREGVGNSAPEPSFAGAMAGRQVRSHCFVGVQVNPAESKLIQPFNRVEGLIYYKCNY